MYVKMRLCAVSCQILFKDKTCRNGIYHRLALLSTRIRRVEVSRGSDSGKPFILKHYLPAKNIFQSVCKALRRISTEALASVHVSGHTDNYRFRLILLYYFLKLRKK